MIKLTAEQKALVEDRPAALATVCTDGRPHVIGVAALKVVEPDKILITDNYMQTTKANIEQNPAVALVVWDESLSGWQFKGTAEYHNSGKWLNFIKNMKENKSLPAKGAILVTVREVRKSA